MASNRKLIVASMAAAALAGVAAEIPVFEVSGWKCKDCEEP